jgi:hypothetical protein
MEVNSGKMSAVTFRWASNFDLFSLKTRIITTNFEYWKLIFYQEYKKETLVLNWVLLQKEIFNSSFTWRLFIKRRMKNWSIIA